MSFGRRNRGEQEIDLKMVLVFMRMLWCMAAGITVLTLFGTILSAYFGGALVIYQMTLVVNGIMLTGGAVAIRKLQEKNLKLEEKEENDCDE